MYIYQKGKGWVIEPPYYTVMFKEGLTRLEPRIPNIGEHYALFGKYNNRDDGLVKDNKVNYDLLLTNWGYNKISLRLFSTRKEGTKLVDNFIYITLVPI